MGSRIQVEFKWIGLVGIIVRVARFEVILKGSLALRGTNWPALLSAFRAEFVDELGIGSCFLVTALSRMPVKTFVLIFAQSNLLVGVVSQLGSGLRVAGGETAKPVVLIAGARGMGF